MSEFLGVLSSVLDFVLTAFEKIFLFVNSNPILAISIYLPFAIFLICSVFNLVSSVFRRKD